MGRPAMLPGTYGKIWRKEHAPGKCEARTRFRDYDGVTRPVRAAGPTEAAAERNLKKALRDRQGPTGVGITDQTRLRDLADRWLNSPTNKWSTGTRGTYTYIVKNQVKPALGGVRVGEAKVSVIDRALEAIYLRHGPSAAKSTKSVLSGMFKLALRHDACAVNPVRDTMAISIERTRARALTADEEQQLTDGLRSNDLAIAYDLPDLVDWMLATGCRIGEALATRADVNSEGNQVLDLTAGTWEVNATIKRVTGEGMVIQRRTKSDAGWRIIAVPDFAVEMVRGRGEQLRLRGPDGVVFGAPVAKTLRDPSNTENALKRVLRGLDCPDCDAAGWLLHEDGSVQLDGKGKKIPCEAGPFAWVTSHNFRKTVATRLEEAGRTPRQVADHIGHRNPSMTLDHYFGRAVVDADAARILNREPG